MFSSAFNLIVFSFWTMPGQFTYMRDIVRLASSLAKRFGTVLLAR
jgi:hypothetical protein